MAPKTAYTEFELAQWMDQRLGQTAELLTITIGGSTPGGYQTPIDDALLLGGWSNISQATDIKKLLALARVCLWRFANERATVLYNYSADGGTYGVNNVANSIRSALDMAETEALTYSPNYNVLVQREKPTGDPYSPVVPTERTSSWPVT